jgi:hypothetical protein
MKCISHVLWAGIVTSLILGGCRKSLPTPPTELSAGIVIYEHANYLGRSAHVTSDIRDLKSFQGPCERTETNSNGTNRHIQEWDDCMSSVRIAPGWRATIYEHDDFTGERLEVVADVPNLQLVNGSCSHDGLNDCITSIRLFRP